MCCNKEVPLHFQLRKSLLAEITKTQNSSAKPPPEEPLFQNLERKQKRRNKVKRTKMASMAEPPESYKPYRLKHTLTGHNRAVSSIKFSDDGHYLASCFADKTARTYSLSSPETTHNKFHGHESGISDLAFSSDGRFLATASDDRNVRLWDVATGYLIKTLAEHINYVFCVNFNPQSNMLASGSFDETVCIRDVKSRKCLKVLPAHSDPVTAVHFNLDGSMIVSSSYDGLCRIWDASTVIFILFMSL